MGIEIPEQYGGAGATFFTSMLVVEELAHVDASVGGARRRAEHARQQRAPALGRTRSRSEVPPEARHRHGRRLRALRGGLGLGRVRARVPRRRTRATTACSPAASSGSRTRPRPSSSSCSPTSTPTRATRASPRFLVERDFPGFSVGQEGGQARHPRLVHLRADPRGRARCPKENVLGEVGKGYKIAIETLNEGRIGIGAQMLGVAHGALEHAIALRAGAQAVRQAASPSSRGCSSRSPSARPSSRPRASWSTTPRASRTPAPPFVQRGRDGQALRLARSPSR